MFPGAGWAYGSSSPKEAGRISKLAPELPMARNRAPARPYASISIYKTWHIQIGRSYSFVIAKSREIGLLSCDDRLQIEGSAGSKRMDAISASQGIWHYLSNATCDV